MKSKFITDPQDPSDGFLNSAGAEFFTNFFPLSSGNSGGNPAAHAPVQILSTPVLTSEAVQSSSAQTGTTSVTTLTSGRHHHQSLVRCRRDGCAGKLPGGYPAGGIDFDGGDLRQDHGQHQDRL